MKFANALMLTSSRVWIVNTSQFLYATQLWPLVIRFHSIACERMNRICSDFAYTLTLTRSRLGSLLLNFQKFTRVISLDYHKNFISPQYLENNGCN